MALRMYETSLCKNLPAPSPLAAQLGCFSHFLAVGSPKLLPSRVRSPNLTTCRLVYTEQSLGKGCAEARPPKEKVIAIVRMDVLFSRLLG